MAKFYATFGGENGSFNGVNFYDKLTVANNRTALISARNALSGDFYAQIDEANKNGNLGIVIPRDGYTGSAGGLGGPTLYTYDITKYNADPTVRPVAPVLVGGYLGSIAGTIGDPWGISRTNYDTAVNLVSSTITGINGTSVGGVSISNGPFGRLGLDPYRTLASLHYDTDLTYFAWNDFLPGQLKALVVDINGDEASNPTIYQLNQPFDIPINIKFNPNTDYEFKNDASAQLRITASLEAGTYSLDTGYFNKTSNASGTGWSWDASTHKLTWTLNLNYGTYTGLSANAWLKDETSGDVGNSRSKTSGSNGFIFAYGNPA